MIEKAKRNKKLNSLIKLGLLEQASIIFGQSSMLFESKYNGHRYHYVQLSWLSLKKAVTYEYYVVFYS